MRHAIALCLALGCGSPPPDAPLPEDHTALFARDHRGRDGCERCHGPDPCARCHQARPPRDHGPGYAGRPHAFAGRAEPARCATCHTGPLCGRCHD